MKTEQYCTQLFGDNFGQCIKTVGCLLKVVSFKTDWDSLNQINFIKSAMIFAVI